MMSISLEVYAIFSSLMAQYYLTPGGARRLLLFGFDLSHCMDYAEINYVLRCIRRYLFGTQNLLHNVIHSVHV